MRPLPALFLTFLLLAVHPVRAGQFGNAPRDEGAKSLCDRIAGTYHAQGIRKAGELLDLEGRAFIKKSGATARYDFFSGLMQQATAGKGRADQDWSLALTEWCYQFCRDVGEDYWYSKFAPEMHRCYFLAGRYGAARAVIEQYRVKQMENREEIDIDQFAKAGMADPAFPAIALRTPGKMERIPVKQFIFFIAQAEQDLAEGKWRRGMEAAAMGYTQAMGTYKWSRERPNLTDSKVMMTEVTGHWRMMRYVMAKGYRFLDLPELELKECRELSSFNLEEGRCLFEVQMAKARARHLKCVLGMQDASVLGEMERIRQLQLTPEYNALEDADRVHLMMADVNFITGNAASGWKIINGLREKKDMSRDMRYEVDMEWCRHRVGAAEYDSVEKVLIELLKIAREGGLKQREIGLYEIYARLLVGMQRYEDALVIQNELIRLLKSFDLFTRLPSALHQLACIHALMGQEAQARASLAKARNQLDAAVMPEDSKARLRAIVSAALPDAARQLGDTRDGTDLQPVRAVSIPLAGLPARGLFTLTNFSAREVRGKVSFSGAGLAFLESAEGTLSLGVDEAAGKNLLTRDLVLPAGSVRYIDLSRSVGAGEKDSAVSILWQPAPGRSQSAEWKAEQEEQAVSMAVTDAADYLENPFYLVPIYHLMQYKDTFAQVADMRVVASQPARVELYNQNDELVFVDADGDGAFTSEGDIISQDLNRNGWGDMSLRADVSEMRFRMLVLPHRGGKPDGISVDIQLFQAGNWVTHSLDKLLFPESGK